MENEKLKTGTTTIGIVYNNGVILAADMRATAGYLVVDKNVSKVQKINDRMAITTAGSVSDIQLIHKLIKAEIKLKEIRTNREVLVKEAANLLGGILYSQIRNFFPGIAHFLLGGADHTGIFLYDLYPDGSISKKEDYIASGSGSVFALGVLEANYRKDLSLNEAKELAIKAVNAALQRDIASGNGITLMAITKEGVKELGEKHVDLSLK